VFRFFKSDQNHVKMNMLFIISTLRHNINLIISAILFNFFS